MKNNLTILFLITIFFSACKKDKETQTPNPTNPTYSTFAGKIGANDNSTIITSDNNLVICGNANGNICLIKTSKSGNQIWRKDFWVKNDSTSTAIVETTNHDFLICSTSFKDSVSTYADILVIKTNSSGDTLWTKTYGSIRDDRGYNIIKTNDNNYLLAGISLGDFTNPYFNICLIKINEQGDTLWSKTFQAPDYEYPLHVLQTQSGDYLVTGYLINNNQKKLLFLKVDANGLKLWDKIIPTTTSKSGYSTTELSNGNFLTCGMDILSNQVQILLVKTDNNGNVYWEKEFGESNLSEKSYSIKPNSDGTFTITGSCYDPTTLQDDIMLMKVDQNGNQVWYKKFGGTETESGINLIKDNNGDNIITGTTYSYGTNASTGNIFITKTDDSGSFK